MWCFPTNINHFHENLGIFGPSIFGSESSTPMAPAHGTNQRPTRNLSPDLHTFASWNFRTGHCHISESSYRKYMENTCCKSSMWPCIHQKLQETSFNKNSIRKIWAQTTRDSPDDWFCLATCPKETWFSKVWIEDVRIWTVCKKLRILAMWRCEGKNAAISNIPPGK